MVGFWWTAGTKGQQYISLLQPLIVLTCLSALTYESGYKKSYGRGKESYFYIMYIPPLIFSLGGFTYGLFHLGYFG